MTPYFKYLSFAIFMVMRPSLKGIRCYSSSIQTQANNIHARTELKNHLKLKSSDRFTPAHYLEGIKNIKDLTTVMNIASLSFHRVNYPQPAETLLFHLLTRSRISKQISDVQTIKHIWDHHFQICDNMSLKILYFSTVIHILLNSGQYILAKEYFLKLHDMDDGKKLPTLKLIHNLLQYRDYDGICDVLDLIDLTIIPEPIWLDILSSACIENHYRLTQLAFDNYLVSEIQEALVISKSLKDINNSFIDSILQVLCIHGDISRCLKLIESIKLRSFEPQLSKLLSVKIIEAYCYHENDDHIALDANEAKTYVDTSIEKVIDVIGAIMEKSSSTNMPNYKDISPLVSHRFMNYRTYDENIALNEEKLLHYQRELDSPKKLTNENLKQFPLGNVLANLNILSDFTKHHISYIQNNNYPCMTLFINCMLNHINLHQNFSGMARLLVELHNVNGNFISQWLDQDSINIIINCMRHSQAKISSLYVFKYVKQTSQFKITQQNYHALIESSLRGDFKSQLLYYLQHYYQDYGEVLPQTMDLINELPQALRPTLEEIHSKPDQEPIITNSDDHGHTWKYNYTIDERDSIYIKYIFQVI